MEHLKKSDFSEKVIKSEKTVLVDFFAEWCGPCKMMAPILEETAEQLKGKINFYKVDVDQESELANQYQVMSIPTIFVFKAGKVVNQLSGYHDKEDLLKVLE